jgi:hypothetical protein
MPYVREEGDQDFGMDQEGDEPGQEKIHGHKIGINDHTADRRVEETINPAPSWFVDFGVT